MTPLTQVIFCSLNSGVKAVKNDILSYLSDGIAHLDKPALLLA